MRLLFLFLCFVLLGIGWELGGIHSALDKIAANTAVVQKPTTNRQSTPLQDSIAVPIYIMDSNDVRLP